MAYYPMLSDEELIRHISTMYQPSELEKELAERLQNRLDKVAELEASNALLLKRFG